MYRTSRTGIQFLTSLEGSSATVYTDIAGFLTIGVGHLLTPAEIQLKHLTVTGSSWEGSLSEGEILTLLQADVIWAEKAVWSCIHPRLYQWEFDALVSFTFNIGGLALKNSTLAKRLNQGFYSAVGEEMLKWNIAGGGPSQGLLNRRIREKTLWETGAYG